MTSHEEVTIDLDYLDMDLKDIEQKNIREIHHKGVTARAARAYLALKRTPAPVQDAERMVWCVYKSGDQSTHIFSTLERAKTFADAQTDPCVLWDYLIDNPSRYYERTN